MTPYDGSIAAVRAVQVLFDGLMGN